MATRMPDTASRSAMAEMFGITPQRVGQLAALGVFKKAPDGSYVLEGSVDAYADFRAKAEIERRASSKVEGIRRQQLRRLELQLEREDAELITREEALAFAKAMIDSMVAAFLTIPSRLDEGSALRTGCESAMPGYAKELEGDLLKCIGPLEAPRTATRIPRFKLR